MLKCRGAGQFWPPYSESSHIRYFRRTQQKYFISVIYLKKGEEVGEKQEEVLEEKERRGRGKRRRRRGQEGRRRRREMRESKRTNEVLVSKSG